MFFSFLSHLSREDQNKIIENWNRMRKQQEEKQRLLNAEKLKLERQRIEIAEKRKEEIKKKEEQEKFMDFLRKNPPKTFKDMMVVGPFMAEYYKNKKEEKEFSDKNTQYDESDFQNNEKSWLSW